MPTSDQEAAHIHEIINDYLTPQQAKSITQRLEAEVGQHTDNSSLKISLEMLKALYSNVPDTPPARKMWPLWLLVTFHAAILIGNTAAIILLPFLTPWYVSLPIISLLVNLMFSPMPCPLTRLESRMRQRRGLPRIRHFLKHYLVDPMRKQRRFQAIVEQEDVQVVLEESQ